MRLQPLSVHRDYTIRFRYPFICLAVVLRAVTINRRRERQRRATKRHTIKRPRETEIKPKLSSKTVRCI